MISKSREHNNIPGTALPLVVAVTGHRDLVSDEMDDIRTVVRDFFQDLQQRYPTCSLTIMSPLAEGADTLVAEIACEMSLQLVVPLPKSKARYLKDFRSEEARSKFLELCDQASDVYELPEEIPEPPVGIDPLQWESDFPYSQLGIYLSAHCHILLAVWDGHPSHHLGGTAQVVKFHHDDVMTGITSKTTASQQNLVDDESDLVFHIVCSRNNGNQSVHPDMEPVDWFWYTKDINNPRSKLLPAQHELIFSRIAEFSRDAVRYAEQITAIKHSLLDQADLAELPAGIEKINQMYVIADMLAIHYQKLTLRSLGLIHLMALLMGLMFLLYSDFSADQGYLYLFVFFFCIAWVGQITSRKRDWHRKYLDYRTLAEGLRIQFYWAASGVMNENNWRYTHDSFLQSQNPEFGWIRNIMRIAGARCDATFYDKPAGMKFSLKEWIGNENSGQLGYFQKRSKERVSRHQLTRGLGLLSLATSVCIVIVFLLFGTVLPGTISDFLRVLMGTLLLLFAVREGYAYSTAEKELIKQYEYMLGIYGNAARRLTHVSGIAEKKQVLRALGQSALNEHSNWILMHRERSPEKGEIWRLGS